MSRFIPSIVCIILFFMAFARPADAYLDPASGSMILQVIVAAVAAVAITLKAFWHRIRAFFGGRRSEEAESEKKS